MVFMSGATQAYERAVVDVVAAKLHDHLAGHSAESLGPPERVAERMLATVPTPHPWDVQIGPFYDTAGVVRLLAVSRQAVADRVRRRTLLAANTAQGRVVYPTWQFAGNRVDPAVSRTVSQFRDVPVDGWAIASWFTTPADTLGRMTPADWLQAGNGEDCVQALAADIADRWRS
jgi:hypothetical protein